MTVNKVERHISDHRLADLLCSAFEGGSNYWIESATAHDTKQDGQPWGNDYTPSYIRAPFSTGGKVEVLELEYRAPKTLDRAALVRGINVLANKYPHHYAAVLTENNDAETGDAFLQCCLFGEIIYG